jgi:transposase
MMQKIPKPEDTAEFKEQAVKRVKDGKTVGAAAKEMGLVEQTLRHWVKASDAGKRDGAGTRKVTPDEMERSRLRAEVIRLKREVEILKNRPRGFSRARWIETGSRLHSW